MRETGKGGVQDRCVKYAKAHGWYARKFKSPANNAVPDYIFAKEGHVLFVEFKATGEKPTPLQLHEHEQMRAALLRVKVIDDPAVFESVLNHLDPDQQ